MKRYPLDVRLSDPNAELATVQATAEEMLAAATEYARTGWYIYPSHIPRRFGPQGDSFDRATCSCGDWRTPFKAELCCVQGKHGIPGWKAEQLFEGDFSRLTGGLQGATNDVELVCCYWTNLPAAGICVDVGRSGLVVIDVDDQQARRSLQALVTEHGRLDSWVCLTARGEHHWLTVPEGMRPVSASRVGFEIKTGQVHAPPSWHCTGVQRKWLVRSGVRPPEAPPWLLRPKVARTAGVRLATGQRFPAGTLGGAPTLLRLRSFVQRVVEADDGRHDLLVQCWYAAGSFAANGWIDVERVENEVLVPLVEKCGRKHMNNLEGFRSALRSGLDAPEWARQEEVKPTWP